MSGTNKLSAPILSSSRPETTAPGSREILLALICLSRCRSKVSSNPSGLGGAEVCSSVPNNPRLSPQLRNPPRPGEAAPVQGGGGIKRLVGLGLLTVTGCAAHRLPLLQAPVGSLKTRRTQRVKLKVTLLLGSTASGQFASAVVDVTHAVAEANEENNTLIFRASPLVSRLRQVRSEIGGTAPS